MCSAEPPYRVGEKGAWMADLFLTTEDREVAA